MPEHKRIYPQVWYARCDDIADDAPVTMVGLFQFHGLPVPQEAYDKDAPDPWHSVMSTNRIRHEVVYARWSRRRGRRGTRECCDRLDRGIEKSARTRQIL